MSTVQQSTIQLSPAGPTLAYSLHRPPIEPPQPVKLALVAHPLGRLGGSKEDHVVVAVSKLLVSQGWTVCRFDSRGSGGSSGSASWTCQAEAQDYRSIFELVLAPLAASNAPPTRVLLAGYSAGSLAASAFAATPSSIDLTQFTFEYLLISYPLSVVPFLTLFHSSTFHAALTDLVRSGAPVLALFGDGDQFTSVAKYRTWAEGHEGEQHKWKAVEFEDADHFWRDREAKRRMLAKVVEWLEGDER